MAAWLLTVPRCQLLAPGFSRSHPRSTGVGRAPEPGEGHSGHWAQRPLGTVEGQPQLRRGQVDSRAGEECVTDGAWGSPGSDVEGGWDMGQVRGEAGRGSPCPWRGVCITHRRPLAGPGLRAQEELGRTGALRIQRAGLPQVCFLFFVLSQALPWPRHCAGGHRHRRASKCEAPVAGRVDIVSRFAAAAAAARSLQSCPTPCLYGLGYRFP